FPTAQRRENGNIIGRERVLARTEGVTELSQIDKLSGLRFADDELGAAFDLLVHVRITEGDGVARVILPLDDFQKLRFEIIYQSHSSPFALSVSSEGCVDL